MQQTAINALDELKSDHERLKDWFQRWEIEPEGTPRDTQLIRECLDELEIHSRIEQEIFYPECRRVWEADTGVIDHAVDDHLKMDMRMSELRETLTHSASLRADDFEALMNDALNHIREEERSILPLFDNLTSIRESEEVGARLRRRKTELWALRRPVGRVA
jgi:hypothetical protein